jgi:predicted ATPase
MLDSIRIENFKIFRDVSLQIRPLTVLTGFNSAGKSTVIQALLLTSLGYKSVNVALNGPYGLALGEALDILNSAASESEIRVTLSAESREEQLKLVVPNDRAVTLTAVASSRTSADESFPLRIDTYLSAERLGPRDLLEVAPSNEGVVDVGAQGQFTAHVLAQRERLRVHSRLHHPKAESSITLAGQVEAWLSDMVRPVRVQATWLPGTSAAMIRFREAPVSAEAVLPPPAAEASPESELPTEWMRPSNVGFGLSYALPVIVAGLTAEPGSIFIIENPEAHLHPAGQSRIGHFLALVASSGVQTIVETHSEHVVNGIRLAVAKYGDLDSELAIFHFFGEADISTMSVSAAGTMSDWPQGFFDQAEDDLAELSRVRRGP